MFGQFRVLFRPNNFWFRFKLLHCTWKRDRNSSVNTFSLNNQRGYGKEYEITFELRMIIDYRYISIYLSESSIFYIKVFFHKFYLFSIINVIFFLHFYIKMCIIFVFTKRILHFFLLLFFF